MITGYAHYHNGKLYYEADGVGEPLLLIHGIDSDIRLWDDQYKELSKHFRVIRFDLRGFGNSPFPEGECNNNDDILLILQTLGIENEKVNLVGYSFGGTIAVNFALEYPDHVNSIILVSPGLIGYAWSEESIQYHRNFHQAMQDRDFERMFDLLYWKSVYGQYRTEEEIDLDTICQKLRLMFEHALTIPREGKLTPIGNQIERLHEIASPTLVVTGKLNFDDYKDVAQIYTSKIPNAKMVLMEGVSHLVNMEQPETFNNLVRDFLAC
ncbi:alpha/beta hydrolase [Paenibacillus sp. GP183]|uniref:alpha/beta fold hydrolase n=1 Tax=Paenibacillus sp. GP183 TaxID=1882751 RepID=UPI00089B9501|nr:alpha/beta hydrolase [Paenibacillus sp. GP183]SEB45742.1 Pimeloyl-ACP methyl ester carboxylesterase [Paenibacillus sp. GP183]